MKHFDDLTKINVPFRKLDKDTQDRLGKCIHVKYYSPGNRIWINTDENLFFSNLMYRQIAPTPMTRQQVLERFNVKVED